MDKVFKIKLGARDLKVDLADSGSPIDLVAMAIRFPTRDESFIASSDYEIENLKYALEHYDYYYGFIEALNAKPILLNDYVVDPGAVPYETFDKLYEKSKSDLLAGAWFALEHPEAFEQSLDDWTYKIKEMAPTWNDEGAEIVMPKDLVKELQQASEAYYENQHDEWLRGDRSSGGFLSKVAREYSADIKVNETKDTISFTWDEDGAGEFMSGFGSSDDNEAKLTNKLLKETLVWAINSNASRNLENEKELRFKRAEEYKATKEYKEKQKAEAEAERVNKLKAMKKPDQRKR